MLNVVPPIVSLKLVAPMLSAATAVPGAAALNTWIMPALPRVGGAENVILSGGSGHTPWLFGAGNAIAPSDNAPSPFPASVPPESLPASRPPESLPISVAPESARPLESAPASEPLRPSLSATASKPPPPSRLSELMPSPPSRPFAPLGHTSVADRHPAGAHARARAIRCDRMEVTSQAPYAIVRPRGVAVAPGTDSGSRTDGELSA